MVGWAIMKCSFGAVLLQKVVLWLLSARILAFSPAFAVFIPPLLERWRKLLPPIRKINFKSPSFIRAILKNVSFTSLVL